MMAYDMLLERVQSDIESHVANRTFAFSVGSGLVVVGCGWHGVHLALLRCGRGEVLRGY
jgi:hypothetical protein